MAGTSISISVSPIASTGGTVVAGGANLLLDQYPGAVAAFSLRKLRAGYTGPAIRVRRGSDNAEQDIGFDANGDLDTATLLSFIGVANGTVATWYDQSGNGNDAVQTTLGNQPRIVASESVDSDYGRPAISFANDFLDIPSRPLSQARDPNVFVVCNLGGTTNAYEMVFTHSSGQDFDIRRHQGNRRFQYVWDTPNSVEGSASISDDDRVILSVVTESAEVMSAYLNGSLDAQINTPRTAIGNRECQIGARSGAYQLIGNVQELVVYDSHQDQNRVEIESNLQEYYVDSVPLLDMHTGATAAFSLRKLRTGYTGAAIRVRRSSDNAEQDIGFASNGDLDTAALLSFVGGGDGFVTTWYDQSGNSNNATSVTLSEQPYICQSGVIRTLGTNSKVTIEGDGTRFFRVPTIGHPTIGPSISGFAVAQADTTGSNVRLWGFNASPSVGPFSTNWAYYQSTDGVRTLSVPGTTLVAISAIVEDNNPTDGVVLRVNGESPVVTGAIEDTQYSALLLLSSSTPDFDGVLAEFIFYAARKDDGAEDIMTNQNAYYGIW